MARAARAGWLVRILITLICPGYYAAYLEDPAACEAELLGGRSA
jgi:hypothetical protein